MSIFGGEKYSKGVFENATEERTQAEGQAEMMKNTILAPELYTHLRKEAEKAKQRIEKLHGKGQAEAIALNEEYDRLMASTLEAVKALQEFEKNKLGMSEEETKS